MKSVKDRLIIVFSILVLIIGIIGFIKLEIDVQARWDKYEQRVFREMEEER